MTTHPIPKAIHREDSHITITWADDHRGVYPARALRLQCHCAACREELTGRPLLDPARVPAGVTLLTVTLVGSYAIRIEWSDGHGTGIYTYEHLLSICPCAVCKSKRGEEGQEGQEGQR